MIETDICIIGSGPAGMAAARCASEGGADVLVLDEQATSGGQIYRAMAEGGLRRADLLGTDYGVGVPLVEGMNHAGIRRQACSTVWWVDGEGTVAFSVDGKADKVRAKRIIVAAGATERPFPFPGWTLPGVMMCGAAQILMKANGVVVKDAVLAGSGPLLYLVAQQLIAAGAPPKALVETQEFGSMIAATRHAFGALRGWRQIVKGLGMLYQIRRAGVRRFTGAKNLRAVGDGRIEALTFRIGGREERIECSTLLLHQGVVPNVQITRALRVAHDWDARQFCWKPRIDAWGTTELSNVAVAGDSGGIAGAKAAEPTGRLVALEALRALGRIDTAERDRRSIVERRALAYELAPRPFLDTLYPPCPEALAPSDDTLVCRCEEVTAAEIREFIRLGSQGPNQAKVFGRSGMGPCQGLYCGLTVAGIFAAETGRSPEDIGYFRIRNPIKGVTLGELAAVGETTANAAE